MSKPNPKPQDHDAQPAGTQAQTKLARKDYERELAALQAELVHLQEWVVTTGAKVCVVFEGRDSAGKGGVIKRLTERVSPRIFRVVALPRPVSARSPRCTSSVTSRTFPPGARS